MGIFEILFGGSSKPRITPKEFKWARRDLMTKGFSRLRRERLEQIFVGDIDEKVTSADPKGIEKDELDQRIKWLRENKSKHGFSDREIEEIDRTLRKYL